MSGRWKLVMVSRTERLRSQLSAIPRYPPHTHTHIHWYVSWGVQETKDSKEGGGEEGWYIMVNIVLMIWVVNVLFVLYISFSRELHIYMVWFLKWECGDRSQGKFKRRKVLDETRRRGQEGLMGPHGVWELVPVEAWSRRVYVYLFILCILSQIHYTIWDFSPKNTNIFWDIDPKITKVFGI